MFINHHHFIKLNLVLSFSLYSFTALALAGDKEKILNADIEGIKIGMNFKEVTNLVEKDNRYENVKIPKAETFRFSSGVSISLNLNTDDDTSCKIGYRFADKRLNKDLKFSKNNPPVIYMNKRCKYLGRGDNKPDFSSYISKIKEKYGDPDYISTRGDLTLYFLGTNKLSTFQGMDDLSEKCSIEIKSSGKAGTNSKAVSMAKKAIRSKSRMFPYEDIEIIEKNKKHPIFDVCPSIAEKYLQFLKERYTTTLRYKINGNEKNGVRETRMLLQKGGAGGGLLLSDKRFLKPYNKNNQVTKENEAEKSNVKASSTTEKSSYSPTSQHEMEEKIRSLKSQLESCKKNQSK